MMYYGVKTTGIYCRSGCKSRAPRPENVVHFGTAASAADAGFRPCKRCRPGESTGEVDERLVQVCRIIEAAEEPPSLAQLASLTNMSAFHLQRRFKNAIGVSPKQYAQTIKRERMREQVNAGYAWPASEFGMTPAQFRDGGRDVRIAYTIVDTAIGAVLIAATQRGICRVDIADDARTLEKRLRAVFPQAQTDAQDAALRSAATSIVEYLAGRGPWPVLPLDVRPTAFQARVWQALRAIAPGTTASYSELAEAIGSPKAARAVARACAANPIALLIPCHRIVPRGGGTGGYRWDPVRKKRVLEIERV